MLGTYTWRGKTYKTIAGLHDRALKYYPRCSVSFDKDNFVVRGRNAEKTVYLYFNRTFDTNGNSIIATESHAKIVVPV
jgi:hypothetical protein